MHIHALAGEGTYWHTEGGTCANTTAHTIFFSLSLTHTHIEDKTAQSVNILMLQPFTFQVNHLSLHPVSLVFSPIPPIGSTLCETKGVASFNSSYSSVYPHTSGLAPAIILLHNNLSLKTKMYAMLLRVNVKPRSKWKKTNSKFKYSSSLFEQSVWCTGWQNNCKYWHG